jgi:hypothetical protein
MDKQTAGRQCKIKCNINVSFTWKKAKVINDDMLDHGDLTLTVQLTVQHCTCRNGQTSCTQKHANIVNHPVDK